MSRLLISQWFRPSLVFAGLVVAGCGPQVGAAGEAEASATEAATATDSGTDTAQSGCPNDSQSRTGYCFERVDLLYEQSRPFAGDFLGDGLPAIALFHEPQSADDGNLSVFRWTGSMTPVATVRTTFSGPRLTIRLDGDRDEVIRLNGNRLYRYRVEGGSLQSLEAELWPGPSVAGVFPLVAFDTDLDGVDEIISFDAPRVRELDLDYAPVVVVERTPDGWAIDRDLPLQPFRAAATVADVTGDGRLELLIGEQRTNEHAEAYDPAQDQVVVFRPTAQGLVEIGRAPLGVQHVMLTTGDVDGDGLQDILVPRYIPTPLFGEEYDEEPRPIAVLRNLGDAVFEEPVLVEQAEVTSSVASLDLDGDGQDELVFEQSPTESVEDRRFVALSDALGSPSLGILVDTWGSGLLVADFNHDGTDDLVFDNADGSYLLMPID